MNTEEAWKLHNEGRCIVCHRPEEGRRRGLCNTHYTRFYKKMASIDDESMKNAYEELLISRGHLLPSRQGQRKSEGSNVFDEAYDEIVEKLAIASETGRDKNKKSTGKRPAKRKSKEK